MKTTRLRRRASWKGATTERERCRSYASHTIGYGEVSATSGRSSENVMRVLQYKVAKIKKEPDPVLKRLSEVEARLAALEAVLHTADPELPALGEFEAWMESPDAARYAGENVAYLLGEGVVANDPTEEGLASKIQSHPRLNELGIAFVPNV